MAHRTVTPLVRFWNHVEKLDGCWIWRGPRTLKGYGLFSIGRKFFYAHRYSWELANSPIPEGMLVCHHCDNPACVNPDHLFMGTAADNTADMVAKDRHVVGVRNPLAKVNEDQVRQIRKLCESGMPQHEVGRRFGVHQMTVSRIVRRKTYYNVA